jgi:hypothetical protein
MKDEGFLLLDLNEFGEPFHRLLHVDHLIAVVVEGAEEAIDPEVDRRGLDVGPVEGVDADRTVLDGIPDVAVGEDHWRESTDGGAAGAE